MTTIGRDSQPIASGTSSWTPPDASCAPFARSLTTTVFSQRSTGWFGARLRRPTPEGHTSISRTALLSEVSYTAPPLAAFVTHPYDGHRANRPSAPLPATASNSKREGCIASSDRRDPRRGAGAPSSSRCQSGNSPLHDAGLKLVANAKLAGRAVRRAHAHCRIDTRLAAAPSPSTLPKRTPSSKIRADQTSVVLRKSRR
jgi:hypothetical protein